MGADDRVPLVITPTQWCRRLKPARNPYNQPTQDLRPGLILLRPDGLAPAPRCRFHSPRSSTLAELSCMHTFQALEGWQRLDRFAGLPLGEADLIKALQIQPEFRSRAKKMGQAQGRVAGDGAPPIQDFSDEISRNIQLPRQFC